MNDALNYAQQEANTFKNSLQYLIEQQNQQKLLDQQALTQRYDNLVNQINQQKTPIQQRYSQDAQGAYVNKMMAEKQLNQTLSQLGLNTQGFGINQQMLNENAYGRNIGALAADRNAQLQSLENQTTNVLGQQQADLYSLDATYANRLNELNRYITESTQQKYESEYARKLDELRYKDQLKQQSLDNTYRNRAIKSQALDITPFDDNEEPSLDLSKINLADLFKTAAGGVGDVVGALKNPIGALVTAINKNKNKTFTGETATKTDSYGNPVDYKQKTNYYFKNSKQPRYLGGKELTNKENIKYSEITKTLSKEAKALGISLTQNVWSDGTNYYIWAPKRNEYLDVTDYIGNIKRARF